MCTTGCLPTSIANNGYRFHAAFWILHSRRRSRWQFARSQQTSAGQGCNYGNKNTAFVCSPITLLFNVNGCATQAILTGAFCIAFCEAVVVILLRNQWGLLFTDNQDIVDAVAQVLPLVAVYVVNDALGPGALSCILRGAGRYLLYQTHTHSSVLVLVTGCMPPVIIVGVVVAPAVINIVAFYVVGLPTGLCTCHSLSSGDVRECC